MKSRVRGAFCRHRDSVFSRARAVLGLRLLYLPSEVLSAWRASGAVCKLQAGAQSEPEQPGDRHKPEIAARVEAAGMLASKAFVFDCRRRAGSGTCSLRYRIGLQEKATIRPAEVSPMVGWNPLRRRPTQHAALLADAAPQATELDPEADDLPAARALPSPMAEAQRTPTGNPLFVYDSRPDHHLRNASTRCTQRWWSTTTTP